MFHKLVFDRVTENMIHRKFKDSKGVIRAIIRRRTDNTMAKRKRTKGQTTISKI